MELAFCGCCDHFAEPSSWVLGRDANTGRYEVSCGAVEPYMTAKKAVQDGLKSVLGKMQILDRYSTQSSVPGGQVSGGDIPPSQMSNVLAAFENSRRKVSRPFTKFDSRVDKHTSPLQVTAALGDGLADKGMEINYDFRTAMDKRLEAIDAKSYAEPSKVDYMVEYSDNPDDILRFAIRNAKRDFYASTQYPSHKHIADYAKMKMDFSSRLIGLRNFSRPKLVKDQYDEDEFEKRFISIKCESEMLTAQSIRESAAKLAKYSYGLPSAITEGFSKLGEKIWQIPDDSTAAGLEEQMTRLLAEKGGTTILEDHVNMSRPQDSSDVSQTKGRKTDQDSQKAPAPVDWESWMGPSPTATSQGSKGKSSGRKGKSKKKASSRPETEIANVTEVIDKPESTYQGLRDAFAILDPGGLRQTQWKDTVDRLSRATAQRESEYLTQYWTEKVATIKYNREQRKLRLKRAAEKRAKAEAARETERLTSMMSSKSKKSKPTVSFAEPEKIEVDWKDVRRTVYQFSHPDDVDAKHFTEPTPESFVDILKQQTEQRATELQASLANREKRSISVPGVVMLSKMSRIPGTTLARAPGVSLFDLIPDEHQATLLQDVRIPIPRQERRLGFQSGFDALLDAFKRSLPRHPTVSKSSGKQFSCPSESMESSLLLAGSEQWSEDFSTDAATSETSATEVGEVDDAINIGPVKSAEHDEDELQAPSPFVQRRSDVTNIYSQRFGDWGEMVVEEAVDDDQDDEYPSDKPTRIRRARGHSMVEMRDVDAFVRATEVGEGSD